MIDLVTGPPGSGKTYFVVDEIYTLLTSKQKKYKRIYTNINGFDYDYANQLAGISGYCLPFTFEQLLQQMVAEYNEHELYKRDSSKYDDYDKHIEQIGIFSEFRNSLIVIDECHLFFTDKKDDIHTRFLSYHRHFNIDMYLVTQNKNLVHKAYLAFVERMIKALPSAKRFLSFVFRYQIYASYQEYHQNKIGTISKKLSQKVYKLYNSGSTTLSKSVLLQMLLPVILLIVAIYFGFTFFQKSLRSNDSVSSDTPHVSNNRISKPLTEQTRETRSTPVSSDHSMNFLLYARCYPDTCVFKQFDQTFSKSALFQIVSQYRCRAVVDSVDTFNIRTFILACDPSIENLINLLKGSENEKTVVPDLIDN